MRTKRDPQFAKDANQSARGVRKLKPREGRPNPYGVQWAQQVWSPEQRKTIREVTTEFFPTEKLRDQRHDDLVAAKMAGNLATATREEIADWRAFQAATAGARWQDVVANHLSWLRHNGIEARTHSVKDAASAYLKRYAKLTANGQRAEATKKKVDRHIGRFVAAFAHLRLDEVKGEQIEDWLDDLDDVESDATFNTYRRDLHAFFEFFVERGELRRNPAAQVKMRDELNETVGVLSIEHTAQLLAAAQHHLDPRHGHRFRRILPRIVLETFGGLRTSSAIRLEKSDINFEDRGITLPKRKLKTKKRHYVSGGFPDVLWEWLALTEERAWAAIDAREYRYLKGELFAAAGVPHPPNCLRHGFASYLLAATKNPGIVAYLLCHRSQDELWDHYNGRVTEADGKRFTRLSPAEVQSIAATVARRTVPAAPPQCPT